MGMMGGIISGAMGGLGGAMERQGDIAQQQQGQYNNMADLAQLNAQLDVQKQASLMRMQQENKIAMLNRLDAQSAPTAQSDQPAQQPQSASVNAAPSTAQSMPQMGLDTSQISPAVLDYLKQQNPDAVAQGIANMQKINANQASIASTTGDAPIPIDGWVSHATLNAPPANYQVPSGVSGSNGQPAVWQPSKELQIAALKSDLYNPGSGLEILKAAVPDATGKMLLAQGIQPGTQAWRDGYTAALTKANGEVMRGGNTLMVGGKPVFAAADSDGNQIVYDGNGTAHIVRLAGANETAIQQAAAEKGGALMGTNPLTIAPLDARPVDANGKPIPVSINAALANGSGGSGAGLAPGIVTGKEGQQKSLTDKWTALNAANQQAQTTNSYLQNIKDLASKAATGPMSDHIDFVNGLRSLLPDSLGAEKATDAVTANDLLDKYQNQIVSRLGQGGMGTDAARSIIASAYPGAHMNLPAINEAVDNLIGANNMVKAKATLLAPHAANLDPVAYQQNELAFDKAADPRIFQYMNMTPAQKTQYVAQHPDAVKVLKEGRDALTSLGVFK